MTLIIAEKKSVGESIATVLNAKERKDGFLQGGGYIVSWCAGHLVELAQADAYDEKYSKWRYADLPVIPSNWKYIVSKDKRKQLELLSSLMRRADIDTIVCATDAGREGELIFRLVYNFCGCKKPVKRLWISSMEESAIKEGFRNLRDGKCYDNLYMAADARAKADWLVGINATRLFTVLYDYKLSVGRVQTPTLSMLVERSQAIASFVKIPFYVPELVCGDLLLSGEKYKDKSDAEAIILACGGKAVKITCVLCKEKTEAPPKLYDLTTLQREANRAHGYTAAETLEYVQSLYEKKLATYPRTDSRYLTSDMADTVKLLVQSIDISAPCNAAQVINDGKVTDHHAIIPTMTAVTKDISVLQEAEQTILQLLIKQLLRAVGERHVYQDTSITAVCEGYEFEANGKCVVYAGWRTETDYKPLPPVEEGQEFTATASIREGFTSPPKYYTEDTLLSAMETAGKDDMPEDAERKGLGTPATRAAIIEKLVKSGYAERKGKELRATQTAFVLISIVPDSVKSPLLTAEWEHRLKQMERGELNIAAFMGGIKSMVTGMVQTYNCPDSEKLKRLPAKQHDTDSDKAAVGKCPRCGGKVYENTKNKVFSCGNRACKFALWQDNKYFATVLKKPLDCAAVKRLLKDGKIKMSGLVSKGGKPYEATIVMQDDGQRVSFKMEFGQ